VSDPGIGYDPAVLQNSRRGLGLISLRERLSYIGGTVDLRSTPGLGTTAVLTAALEHP
jgi:signal transduction histidine kinase